VALPMDEQRILDEMERVLAADDPRLAAKLAAFGRPGVGQVWRTGRARITFALMVVAVVAAVAVVVYLMSAFRLGETLRPQPSASHPPTSQAGMPAVSSTSSTRPLVPGGLGAWCANAHAFGNCQSLISAVATER
jgi:DUF3040 family protein